MTSASPGRRTWARVFAALLAVTAAAAIAAHLTTPRRGGQLDPDATNPAGAYALLALLRDRGVTVVVAHTTEDAVGASTPGSLLVFGESRNVAASTLLDRLARAPGDLLLVDPTPRTRAAMSPAVRNAAGSGSEHTAGCDLRAAQRAGPVDFGPTSTFRATRGTAATSCYGGALIRYRDRDRTVTVVGSSDFLTNGGLLRAGNAALAMNLAGERGRVVWFAPQRVEGGGSGKGRIVNLIPPGVRWMVVELCLAVALLALWKGRRLGPLVAEELPVVVRASETVEGHGRLYRSRRARDRAALALRSATVQRVTPRLGLGSFVPPPTLVAAVATRTRLNPDLLQHTLFGAPPIDDDQLVALARALDDIERQVISP